MVSEEAVRQRSYEIWEREGRPAGRAFVHWIQAKEELENEAAASRQAGRTFEYHTVLYRFEEWQRVVQPKPRISSRPQLMLSQRLSPNHSVAA
ncbi:MAG: DUF2934 domain-containing protein [Alphaproteobacteria bacterium]|nr:DUF2934 domain-containing protein [Alphaproteobacteria bacterium]